jgi:transposase
VLLARLLNAWTCPHPVHGMGASPYLDAWCIRAVRSRIETVKNFARTVRTHRELLLSDFEAKKQFSSGVIEGLNNKAKVALRKAYGYRTFGIAELSLYHVLGKLPEPKLAHRFF